MSLTVLLQVGIVQQIVCISVSLGSPSAHLELYHHPYPYLQEGDINMQRKSPSSGEVACEPSDNIIRQDTKEISRHAYSPIRQKGTKVKSSGTTGSRGQARWQASRYSLAPD